MKAIPAPKIKQIRHYAYLCQPILHFIVLLLVITIFSRCSPLSPSQNKNSASVSSTSQIIAQKIEASSQVNSLVKDDLIEARLKEIGYGSVELSTEKEFEKSFASQAAAPTEVTTIAEQGNPDEIVALVPVAHSNILATIKSNQAEKDLLKQKNGQLRMQLVFDQETAKALQARLQTNRAGLEASAYLLYANSEQMATYRGADLRLKISIANMEENRFVLDIKRDSLDAQRDEMSLALFQAAINDARSLAIVLR
jgi:hypothetical protein